METPVLGTKFQGHHILNPPFLVPYPSLHVSPSVTSRGAKKYSLITIVASTHVAAPPPQVDGALKKRHSKSYLARKAAILEVEQSPDLKSALERFYYYYYYFFSSMFTWFCLWWAAAILEGLIHVHIWVCWLPRWFSVVLCTAFHCYVEKLLIWMCDIQCCFLFLRNLCILIEAT